MSLGDTFCYHQEVFFLRPIPALAACFVVFTSLSGQSKLGNVATAVAHRPTYTDDGRLRPLTDYREWIYLSSGLDMSYTPRAASPPGHSIFDNVFVNPEAYRSFLQTGKWPDLTMFVLELRAAASNASLNKAGQSQSEKLMGVEVHVKDASHGGWAFYEVNSAAPSKLLPKEASCYSCHRDHAAVDTTFVQFYPTLLPLARQKNTLSASYVKEQNTTAK